MALRENGVLLLFKQLAIFGYSWFSAKSLELLPREVRFWGKTAINSIVAGTQPQTLPGSLLLLSLMPSSDPDRVWFYGTYTSSGEWDDDGMIEEVRQTGGRGGRREGKKGNWPLFWIPKYARDGGCSARGGPGISHKKWAELVDVDD